MNESKRVLFISYFYPPYNSVGVKRISYWVDNIKDKGYLPTVFTATEQTEINDNVHYIPANDQSNILNYFIKDEGLSWLKNLKIELGKYDSQSFDYILITGGPFMQMLITKYLKFHFTAKVILDFRDPFYANPRFASSKIKDAIKLYYQNRFLKYTDIVITVNEECKKLIDHPNIELIDNGFDEKVLEKVNHKILNSADKSIFTISATGRVDHDFDMKSTFDALKSSSNVEFNYIGNQRFDKYDKQYNHCGFLPYDEALEFISKSDLCIMFTGGLPFESSTKIFDYLALNKNILIITNGQVETGSLHNITHDYPNVFWANNSTNDIKEAIEKIRNHKRVLQDTSRFSRADGLKKLIQILAK